MLWIMLPIIIVCAIMKSTNNNSKNGVSVFSIIAGIIFALLLVALII